MNDRLVQERISRKLIAFAGAGGRQWRSVHGYIARYLSVHAAKGRVLHEIVNDTGFLGVSDPNRLAMSLRGLLENKELQACKIAQLYHRIGVERIGETVGQRLANLALMQAMEEPLAGLNFHEFREVLPWSVQFSIGKSTTFDGPLDLARGGVTSICVLDLPTRDLIATADGSSRITLWEKASGDWVAELRGHRDHVVGICFVRNFHNEVLVSADEQGEVRIWDPSDLSCKNRIEVGKAVSSVKAFSFDSDLFFAVGCRDGAIAVFDFNGQKIRESKIHEQAVTALSCGVLGHDLVIASGSLDRTAVVCSAFSGEVIKSFSGPTGSILSVDLGDLDGRAVLATANADETIWVWDVESATQLNILEGHTGGCTSVCILRYGDERILASSSADLSVRVWDMNTGMCKAVFSGHRASVDCLDYTFVGEVPAIVSGSADRTMRVWSISDFQLVEPQGKSVRPHNGIWASAPMYQGASVVGVPHFEGVRSIKAVSQPEGDRVVVGELGGDVGIIDMESGEVEARWAAHEGGVLAVATFFDDGDLRIVSGGFDRIVRVWDASNGRLVSEFEGHSSAIWGVDHLVQEGNDIIISGSRDKTVCLWNLSEPSSPIFLSGSQERIWDVTSCNVNGQLLILAASTDRRVWLWDADTGAFCGHLSGAERGLRNLACIMFEGRPIVIGSSADRSVYVWELHTQKLLARLEGHVAGAWGVSATVYLDHLLVASSSDDLTVIIWEPFSGRQISIPQPLPAYSLDFAQEKLVVGAHGHIYSIEMHAALFSELI